jgi:hypothetical protein
MLIAELHGKVIAEAQNNEDCLTSCVFGHLRYLPPSVFWEQFLSCAITVTINGESRSLTELLREQQIYISQYSHLTVSNWPSHPKFGEPDLALLFSGGGMQLLVILVEAKLWAQKSGLAENDQLARYLRSSSDLGSFNPPLPISATVALVYLTPRESLPEVMETLAMYDGIEARKLLFRVQWQDVIDAAERSLLSERDSLHRLILNDVAEFLRRRGLEYFKGFSIDSSLPLLNEKEFAFYSRGTRAFSMLNLPGSFQIERGEWTND